MSWIRFFRKQHWDEERARELQFYIDMETDENIARGMSRQEASTAAHLKLGNATRLREEIYSMNSIGFLETLWHDVCHATRLLRKNPAFTLVASVTLALSIGANTAIFSVINGVMLQPFPFPKQDRLMMLWEVNKDGTRSNTSFATFTDWKNENRSFSAMSAVGLWTPTLVTPEGSENLNGFRVSSTFFDVLGVKLQAGRNFMAEEDVRGNHYVVVLSHALWQRRFGASAEIVGKATNLGSQSYTVVGILPADFPSVFSFDPSKQTDIYAPLAYDATLPYACRSCRHLRAIGRLKSGVSSTQANAEMNQISENLFREHPSEYSVAGVQLMPLKDYVVGDVKPVLYALFGAVGFVLLIACVNVANLLLGWAARRQREVALRAALGAQRMRLIRQFLTESVLLSLLGGLLGLLLSIIGIHLLRKTGLGNLPRLQNVHIDGWVFGFSLGISVLTGLVFGILPAWSASRFGPDEALKENSRATQTKEGGRLRSLLIVSDVAFALILLTGAGLMMKSFVRLLEVNPGFDPQKVLTLQVSLFGTSYKEDSQVTAFYQQALERIETLPGVESAAVVSQIPLGGNGDMYGIHIEDKPNPNPEDDPSGDRYSITPHYFHAMHIPLLSGREFTLQDTAGSSPVVIVNQTLAQSIWPGENPIGKRLRIGDPKSPAKTVIGVAGDVLHRSLNSSHTLQFYLPNTQMADSSIVLVVRTSINPAALAGAVRHEIAAVDPLQPVSGVSTMEEIVDASVMQQRFAVFLFMIFAAIALLLAATGIFGVISSTVTQRTHEIGIRMALGADKQSILRLVASHGLRPALIGAVAGVFASLGLSQFLTSMLFSIKPTDPPTFLLVTGVLAMVAAIACYLPARRAMRVDPIVALRCE